MHYDYIAIPDADVPQPVEPTFQNVLATYAILVHQLLSERRFFAQFVGTKEPPVEELLPPGEKPAVPAYIEKYVWLAKGRLPQLAQGTAAWWLESRPFFGGLQRERIWVFWAACAAHLPPPDAGADVAAPGGVRAGPGDLRAFG